MQLGTCYFAGAERRPKSPSFRAGKTLTRWIRTGVVAGLVRATPIFLGPERTYVAGTSPATTPAGTKCFNLTGIRSKVELHRTHRTSRSLADDIARARSD